MGNWKTASGQNVASEQTEGADLAAMNQAYKARQARSRGATPAAASPVDAARRLQVEKQARRELLVSYLREPLAVALAAAALLAIVLFIVL